MQKELIKSIKYILICILAVAITVTAVIFFIREKNNRNETDAVVYSDVPANIEKINSPKYTVVDQKDETEIEDIMPGVSNKEYENFEHAIDELIEDYEKWEDENEEQED